MYQVGTKLVMLASILLLDIFLYYFLFRRSAGNKTLPKFLLLLFWAISLIVLISFWNLDIIFLKIESYSVRKAVVGFLGMNIAVKFILATYVLLDLLVKAVGTFIRSKRLPIAETTEKKMTRKRFLYKSAVLTASIPLVSKGFGIINRAYDYRIKRERIALPNLPKAFEGITIGQISDIHTGSFNDNVAVQGGVDLLLQAKPDIVFFTGDLVNEQTNEVKDYFNTFKQVKAPLGVYSVLGNHDYGDYRSWDSIESKNRNFQDMLMAHRELGWQLLRNECHILQQDGESLAIIGVENWGIKRFSKYGKLDQAHQGSADAPVKLLLSHDPSHWEAQVLDYPDIDLTFSGHTHGFQFGVEFGSIAWSPAQYLYKQWAGLYTKESQHLYVNRGYGFIGMPGRIGISPEITLVELVRA